MIRFTQLIQRNLKDTMVKCRTCGKEGHIRSNKKFHPDYTPSNAKAPTASKSNKNALPNAITPKPKEIGNEMDSKHHKSMDIQDNNANSILTEIETEPVTTTLINIDRYKKKFETYPLDLLVFAKENNLSLLSLSSMKGQALALMSQPEVRGQKHLGRDEAVKFFQNIGMETTDAIQQFNKATGLKRLKMRGYYCLQYPFESDTTDLDKRKGVSIGGDKNIFINTIKDWWKKNLVDVPNEEWQIGHLDPTINDASEKNLAYQPPIQGKYRDRFKFDPFFLKMWPTASELVPKINTFYTEKEQKEIYEALKQKFEK